MAISTIERERVPIGFKVVDKSIYASIKSSAKLARNVAKIALGMEYTTGLDYQPDRYVELNPDYSLLVTADSGTQHQLDVYNTEALDSGLPPVIMTMELSVPHDRGLKAPFIQSLAEFLTEQDRTLIVQSSAGFKGKAPTISKLGKFSFNTMAHNSFDSLDRLSEITGTPIDQVEVTGGSQGGTNSLYMGTTEIRDQRHERDKKHIQVVGATAIAPPGLKRIGPSTLKQFLIDEPLHMMRKASTMDPETLKQYTHALIDTFPPNQAKPMLLKTAGLYVSSAPLKNIANRLDPDVVVDVAVMDRDGITNPDSWVAEFADRANSNVIILPGHHLSVDSLRKGFEILRWHLLGYEVFVDNSISPNTEL